MGCQIDGDCEDAMENSNYFEERRKYPRFSIDLPLEYQVSSSPKAHGGLVLNASEAGLLLYSTGDMSIGTKLKITVLFPKGYELANFVVTGEIIWKDSDQSKERETHRYGLKFIEIGQEDRWKLRRVLNGGFDLEEIPTINGIHTGLEMES